MNSIYKTFDLNIKYLKDMHLAIEARDFEDYINKGGLLKIETDFFQLRKELLNEHK